MFSRRRCQGLHQDLPTCTRTSTSWTALEGYSTGRQVRDRHRRGRAGDGTGAGVETIVNVAPTTVVDTVGAGDAWSAVS